MSEQINLGEGKCVREGCVMPKKYPGILCEVHREEIKKQKEAANVCVREGCFRVKMENNVFCVLHQREAANWGLRPLKLMVVGHARHGKDTVGEMLRDFHGVSFKSSSLFACEKIVLPAFDRIGKYYDGNVEECYADRQSPENRKFWFDAIVAYNEPDKARMGRELFAEYDCYIGCRDWRQFTALKNEKIFDYSIWVDASLRLGPEAVMSMTIWPWHCDYILDNNGLLVQTAINLKHIVDRIAERRR